MKIEADVQFICEQDGVYVYWVSFGSTGKIVTVRAEDLEDDEE